MKPELKVEYRKISELKPHPKNPRIHPESAVDKLERSIREFGWTNPILVSKDGYILAGECRWKTAKKAGLKEVPVIKLPLSGDKAVAYMVADNKLQDLTDWDFPKLEEVFENLQETDFDLELTGFKLEEIENLSLQVNDIDYEKEWQGMPEFKQEALTAEKSIVVHFASLDVLPEFANLIGQTITEKTRSIWYPKKEHENLKAIKVEDES